MIDVTFIRQGTTPVLEITALDERVADATVYVTIGQGDVKLTKTNRGNDPSVIVENLEADTKITVFLSQADTLILRPGAGKVQVRWVFEDGTAGASEMGYVEVGETMHKGVISYG